MKTVLFPFRPRPLAVIGLLMTVFMLGICPAPAAASDATPVTGGGAVAGAPPGVPLLPAAPLSGLGLQIDPLPIVGRDDEPLPNSVLAPYQLASGHTFRRLKGAPSATLPGIGYFGMLSESFTYGLQLGTADLSASSRRMYLNFERPEERLAPVAVDKAVAGSFRWLTPLQGLSFQGSLASVQGNFDTSPAANDIGSLPIAYDAPSVKFSSSLTSVAAAEHQAGNLRLNAEYVQNRLVLEDESGLTTEQIGEGFSGGAGYRIADWLELGSTYSIYYADREDRDGEAWSARGRNAARAWLRDFALSTRFDFSERMMLQLEGHLMNGLMGLPTDTDEDWMLFTTELQFHF